MRFLISLFMILGVLFAGNLETTKTVCEMAGNKSIEQIKKELLKKVKLAGVEELYGDNIFSQTSIENGKLLSDSIKSLAVGRIRVKGNPRYFNGKNLGEVCVSATLYVTQQDIKDFTPKKIDLKNFCYSNPDVPIKDIKTKAKEAAYLEIISQFSPSLAKKISPDQAADYIHGFKIKNANFDFNKGAYCFDAVATIIPYELKYQKPAAKTQNASETKGAVAANSSEFPEYFNNYIWEGKYKYGRIKAFYIDKNHTLFLIIFFEDNGIYTNIFKIKKNGLKISGKLIIDQKIYKIRYNWNVFSGIVLNNGVFKGVLNENATLTLKKSNQKVKDYFTEIWKGTYKTTEFKKGKIYLMKNDEIKNFWADMYPTKDERGTDTYDRVAKDGVITYYDIDRYTPISGKDYDSFNFTGTMLDKNTFIGAGTKDFVSEIKLKKIK